MCADYRPYLRILGGLNPYIYALANPEREIDPKGLLTIGAGCTRSQAAQVKAAEDAIRKKLQGGCMSCGPTSVSCAPCEYVDKLRAALDRLVVTCVSNDGNCAGQAGGDVNIRRVGFTAQGKTQCGCLRSTIYHELFHDAGLPESRHGEIESYVFDCFAACARRHDPAEYPDYAR